MGDERGRTDPGQPDHHDQREYVVAGNSSFYGLNAGLLANAGGSVTVTGGTITTTGVWSVTANSVLTCLTDSAGASGSAIGNIKGNGHTVTYDSSLAANSWLGGKTYTLVNGGTLAPAAN